MVCVHDARQACSSAHTENVSGSLIFLSREYLSRESSGSLSRGRASAFFSDPQWYFPRVCEIKNAREDCVRSQHTALSLSRKREREREGPLAVSAVNFHTRDRRVVAESQATSARLPRGFASPASDNTALFGVPVDALSTHTQASPSTHFPKSSVFQRSWSKDSLEKETLERAARASLSARRRHTPATSPLEIPLEIPLKLQVFATHPALYALPLAREPRDR